METLKSSNKRMIKTLIKSLESKVSIHLASCENPN